MIHSMDLRGKEISHPSHIYFHATLPFTNVPTLTLASFSQVSQWYKPVIIKEIFSVCSDWNKGLNETILQ